MTHNVSMARRLHEPAGVRKPLPLTNRDLEDLAALADPHRLAFVRFLARILREAGLVTKRIQGAKGYTQLRKQDVDGRFPGLLDSVLSADIAAQR